MPLARPVSEEVQRRADRRSLDAIDRGEDRELFKKVVDEAAPNPHAPKSATTWKKSTQSPQKLRLPAGGAPELHHGWPGSGIAHNEEDLHRIAGAGSASPTDEVLIEEGIEGWKEFELELMRDRNDNVVVVCPSRTSTRSACTPATPSPWPPASP